MQIETPRLLLRPMREQDAPQVFAWCSEPEVGLAAGWKPHESLEETRDLLRESFLGQDWAFAIALRESDRPVGSIALREDARRAGARVRSVGYALSTACWGWGLMPEALRALAAAALESGTVDLLTAYCYPFNTRSQAVLEKCGFVRGERLERCERRFDGCLLDWICYTLARGESERDPAGCGDGPGLANGPRRDT